jgi:hypothetical protein
MGKGNAFATVTIRACVSFEGLVWNWSAAVRDPEGKVFIMSSLEDFDTKAEADLAATTNLEAVAAAGGPEHIRDLELNYAYQD